MGIRHSYRSPRARAFAASGTDFTGGISMIFRLALLAAASLIGGFLYSRYRPPTGDLDPISAEELNRILNRENTRGDVG